jgi:GT2 family glycosyltransferase
VSASGLGVVVASWRRPGPLARCLAGLARQEVAPAEILVAVRADDGPTRTVLAADRTPGLRTVVASEPGAVAARNAALAQSRADVVAFLDDDAVPRPDWTRRLLAHYEDATVGAVGGRDFVYHDGVLEEGREAVVGRVLPYGRFVGFHHLGFGAARDVELLKGANMSVRRTALGGRGFDTELRGDGAEHHEDWALTLRVRRAGWRVVYDPGVSVDHYEAARAPGAPRADPGGRSLVDRLHNQTFAAVRYLEPRPAVAHVLFAVLVGTGVGPGVGQAAVRLGRGEPPGRVARLLADTLRGRVAGVRSGLRARRADHRRPPEPPA